ncbi:WD40 repeat domain-containing protein [Nocardia sp. NPDC058114]|uniref:WD40 repeat domain-containing protein n=1 Tax=Nocardia sp. NPDC058114 TaxID=3346346 RepID=UPI0036DD5727
MIAYSTDTNRQDFSMRVLSAHQSASGTHDKRDGHIVGHWALRVSHEPHQQLLAILLSDPITKRPQPEASSSRFSLYLIGHPSPGPICAQFRLRSTLAESKVPSRPGQSLPTKLSEVAFNADGSKIAVGAHDGKVRIWDVARLNQQPQTIDADRNAVFAVRFFPDGRVVPGGKEGIVRIWGAHGGKIAELPSGKEVASPDVSQKGADSPRRTMDS